MDHSQYCASIASVHHATVESHCSILGCNVFSPIMYCCYSTHPDRRFARPENSTCNVPAYNVLSAVMNYYMLPLSHQLADLPLAITCRVCVHRNAAISSLNLLFSHSSRHDSLTSSDRWQPNTLTCVGSASNSGRCYDSCCVDCRRWIPRHIRRWLDAQ